MKAGIYLRELPIPEVGDEDVLVQNIYSSICGTDIAVYFHGPGTGHKVTFQYFGMEKVMVCDYSDFRLNLAKELRVAICNSQKEDFAVKSKESFGTAPSLNGQTANIDCWLDAAGAEKIVG